MKILVCTSVALVQYFYKKKNDKAPLSVTKHEFPPLFATDHSWVGLADTADFLKLFLFIHYCSIWPLLVFQIGAGGIVSLNVQSSMKPDVSF